MEAKDTVMGEEQISNAKKGHTAIIQAHPSVYQHDIAVAKAQAEISFPAGQTAERERIIDCLEKKYLGGGFGVGKNYSRTARYAVAKEIVLGLVLEGE